MDADLPTGTLTFLMTDVKGSTRLWEQHAEEMRTALMRHDALIEQLVALHEGVLVRPRGEGDSRFAVFSIASRAVAAAADIQRAMHTEVWPEPIGLRIRIALHTGAADLRDGDYYGSVVNRCARLRGLAHGGQTLVSLATAELARDLLPAGAHLRELGSFRLRDLTRPEMVFQLDAAGLPADFPPLVGLGDQLTNLPIQPTALIGREIEIAHVMALLRSVPGRLVTLTGPGGTGKTRLALQTAAELIDDYPDGVWFVDLSAIPTPDHVASAIVRALRVPETADQSLTERLHAFLLRKQILLVLDNFEHVLDAASLVNDLLLGASQLTLLVTSRAALQLRAEQEYPVPSLPLPVLRKHVTMDRLTQYDSVALLIARARAIHPGFAITNNNAPAVAEICVRLDGLPLAIELAAARLRILTPEQLLTNLDQRLGLLTSGARDIPARQRTLRNTIAWSYDLLTAEEQRLFARLSIFSGGWTLDAATAVCRDHGAQRRSGASQNLVMIEELEALVNQSLVQIVTEIPGVLRFRFLELIREFASERLQEQDEGEVIRQHHAEYFAQFVEAAEPKLRSSDQIAWLAQLDADYENIHAALAWSLEQGHDYQCGLRIFGALWYYWFLRSTFTEQAYWAKQIETIVLTYKTRQAQPAEQLAPIELQVLARAAACAGDYFETMRYTERKQPLVDLAMTWAKHVGDPHLLGHVLCLANTSREQVIELVGLARMVNDPWLLSAALGQLANWSQGHNRDDAMVLANESLTLAEQIGDSARLCQALMTAGWIRLNGFADTAGADDSFMKAYQLSEALGSPIWAAAAQHGIARAAEIAGAYDRARAGYTQVIEIERRMGKQDAVAGNLMMIGYLAWDQGDYHEAAALFLQALELVEHSGHTLEIAWDHCQLSRLYKRQGRYDEAMEEARIALSGLRDQKNWFGIMTCLDRQARILIAQGKLSEAQITIDEGGAAVEQIEAAREQTAARYQFMLQLGILRRCEGRYHDACEILRDALGMNSEALYHPNDLADLQCHYADALIAHGDHAGALVILHEALRYAQTIGAKYIVAWACQDLAFIAALEGLTGLSARLWGAAEAIREQIGAPIWPIDLPEYQRRVAAARAQLEPATWAAAWAAGRALTWEQATTEALEVCTRFTSLLSGEAGTIPDG